MGELTPLSEAWVKDGTPIEDADGGIHAQFYQHTTKPLMLMEIFPCPHCAGAVRYLLDKRAAVGFQFVTGKIFLDQVK